MKPKVSIIIPCYNESVSISRNLKILVDYLSTINDSYDFEVIAVNDGSTDNTLEELRKSSETIKNLKVIDNQRNFGKGYSVRTGMLSSSGNIVLFTDADLSTPPFEIARALSFMKKNNSDVVIGSRTITGANITVKQPFYRIAMGKVFAWVMHCIIGLHDIKDTQCGFKVFTGEAAKELFRRQSLNGFSFDVEILYIARGMGYSILEIPVTWKNEPKSSVNPLRDSFRMFMDLLKIRSMHHTLYDSNKNRDIV